MTYLALVVLVTYGFGALAALTTPLIFGGVVFYLWHARRKPVAIFFMLVSMFGGYALSSFAYTSLIQKEADLFHQALPQEGMVLRIDERDTSSRVMIDLEHARVLAHVRDIRNVKRGDIVSVSGMLEHSEDFVSDDGTLVPYRMYLLSQGVVGVVKDANISVTRPRSLSTHTIAFALRERASALVRSSLPEPEASLLLGLIVGDAAGLGEDGDQLMRNAGLTHILVLSGFNITIVGLFLLALFSFLPIIFRAAIAASGIVLLVFASGGDPPALRAGIAGSLALLVLTMGRERSVLHLLLVTLLIMLLANPLLVMNISFQLSALATVGVVTLSDPIKRRLPKAPFMDVLASTLAALISVLPLSIVSFHAISIIAPVANLVVLPLVPVAMLLGVVGVLAVPLLGSAAVLIAYMPLHAVYALGTWFGSLPFASVSVSLSPWLLLAYIPLAIWLMHYLEKKNTA